MIRRLNNNEERRNVCLKLFHDDVFAIGHKALRAYSCKMSIEEIFCTADYLVNHLLTHEITEEEYIDYVVDDFEAELNDEAAAFPILTVVYVKLCAMRKTKPIAGSIARAFVHRCHKFADFQDLLEVLAKVEHQRCVEKGRIDLINYALRTLGDEYTEKQVDEFLNYLCANIHLMNTQELQHLERWLSRYNDANKHIVQPYVNEIREAINQHISLEHQPKVVNTEGGTAILGGNFQRPIFNNNKLLTP